MDQHRQELRARQRDAIWKWRWLGFRESTPGFRGAVVVIVIAVIYVALHLTGVV